MLPASKSNKLVVALWLFLCIAVTASVLAALGVPFDLRVYLNGGKAWLRGLPLYAPGFAKPLGGPDMPFTYPPIAAVAFSALTLLPEALATIAWTLASLSALGRSCTVCSPPAESTVPVLLTGWGAACWALSLEPVYMTFAYGQINLLLMVMVAADCLTPKPRWPRGLLIGFAAAIKLTPALFGVFFLARREWRPAFISAAAFFAASLLGCLLAPQDSEQYWFHALLDPGRVGNLDYTANQSIMGVLHRLGIRGFAEKAAWGILSIGILSLMAIAATRRRRAGEDRAALVAVAVSGLLISPVSWTHHWVWIVLAMMLLLEDSWQRRQYAVVSVVWLIFTIAPHWRVPHERVTWTWWQHIVGNAYVWLGIAGLIWLASRGEPAERAPLPHPDAN